MISIGVLGVGLGMAAALFPAGMKEANSSSNNLLGTMICQNALALIKTKVAHKDIDTALVPIEPDNTDLREADFCYPWNDTASPYSFCAFGRRLNGGENDYQFLVYACKLLDPGNKLERLEFDGTFIQVANEDRTQLLGAVPEMPPAGSFLMIRTGDSFETATISSVTGAIAVLDRRLQHLEGSAWPIQALVERDQQTGQLVERNPLIYQMVARTALRVRSQ